MFLFVLKIKFRWEIWQSRIATMVMLLSLSTQCLCNVQGVRCKMACDKSVEWKCKMVFIHWLTD